MTLPTASFSIRRDRLAQICRVLDHGAAGGVVTFAQAKDQMIVSASSTGATVSATISRADARGVIIKPFAIPFGRIEAAVESLTAEWFELEQVGTRLTLRAGRDVFNLSIRDAEPDRREAAAPIDPHHLEAASLAGILRAGAVTMPQDNATTALQGARLRIDEHGAMLFSSNGREGSDARCGSSAPGSEPLDVTINGQAVSALLDLCRVAGKDAIAISLEEGRLVATAQGIVVSLPTHRDGLPDHRPHLVPPAAHRVCFAASAGRLRQALRLIDIDRPETICVQAAARQVSLVSGHADGDHVVVQGATKNSRATGEIRIRVSQLDRWLGLINPHEQVAVGFTSPRPGSRPAVVTLEACDRTFIVAPRV